LVTLASGWALLLFIAAAGAAGQDGPGIRAFLDKDQAREGARVRLIVEVEGEEAADCHLGGEYAIEGAVVEEIRGPAFEIRPVEDPEAGQPGTRLAARFEVVFVPLEPGRLLIPPIEVFAQRGKKFLGPSLILEVLEGGLPEGAASLSVEPLKAAVYLYERIVLDVRLAIGGRWFEEVERAPALEVLSLPWMQGEPSLVSMELKEPGAGEASRSIRILEGSSGLEFGFRRIREEGRELCVHTARISFIPTTAGMLTFPVAVYRAELDGDRSLVARSPAFEVEVRPLPEAERPDDATNGVGRFQARFELERRVIRVGEPVRLAFSVEGEGNLAFLEMPGFDALEARFRIYAREDERGRNVRRRIFHIAPRSDRVRELPALSFSWFDPEDERYVTARWGPEAISVEPMDVKAVGAPPASEDIETIIQDWGRGNGRETLFVISLVALCFSGLVFAWACARIRRRTAAEEARAGARVRGAYGAFAEKLERMAVSRAGTAGGAALDPLAKSFGEYLDDRFGIAPAETMAGAPSKWLERLGITADLAEEVERFLRALDALRFNPREEGGDPETLVRTARDLVDRLERESAPCP
jgi:hypothetical protein